MTSSQIFPEYSRLEIDESLNIGLKVHTPVRPVNTAEGPFRGGVQGREYQVCGKQLFPYFRNR